MDKEQNKCSKHSSKGAKVIINTSKNVDPKDSHVQETDVSPHKHLDTQVRFGLSMYWNLFSYTTTKLKYVIHY